MKLIMELDSKELQKAVENQVSKAIAEMTEDLIIDKIKSIITTKIGRIKDYDIDLVIENQIAEKLSGLLDIAYLNIRLNSIIRQTIKNGLKNISEV